MFDPAKWAASVARHSGGLPSPNERHNALLPSPPDAKYKLAVVQFFVRSPHSPPVLRPRRHLLVGGARSPLVPDPYKFCARCPLCPQIKDAKNGGSDKGPDGNRIDSIPIANSVINAGAACDLLLYDAVRPAPRIPGGYALAVATPARC